MDEQKRLRAMEESIRTIAQFVKDQTDQIEQQIGGSKQSDLDYLRDEMEELKRRIDLFSEEKEFSRLQFKKLDKLEESLEERMNRLEENARQKGDDKLRKTLQDTRAELDGLKRDLGSKMLFMEQKLNRMDEPELHMEELSGSIERLEREVSQMRTQKKGLSTEDYRREIDKASSEIMGNVKNRISEQEKIISDMSSRIGQIGSSNTRVEIEDLKKDVYSRINRIENTRLQDDEVEQLSERVELIDRKLNESLVAKNHLDDIERNLADMRATFGKIKTGVDADSSRRDMENYSRHGTKEVAELKGALEDEIARRTVLERKLDQVTSNVEDYGKYVRDSLSNVSKPRVDEMNRLNKSAEQARDYELREIKELANQLVKEREEMEKEVVNRMSLERKVNEMEQKMKNMNIAAEEVEDLDVDRLSLERRVQLIDGKLKDMQGSLQRLGNLDNMDMTKLADRLQDMEGNMKMQTIKILTHQLNEFTKSVDRRIPSIVSREEYARQIADINQRLKNVEAPDLSPLAARVSRLEKTIEEVAGMMRSMYNRVPIVVE